MYKLKGKKSLLWPGASHWRICYHRMWVQLSTTRSNVLKQPNGELQVAVNHNQLRTMASETVDPIDWSHPPPSWEVPPGRHVYSINQGNLSGTRTCNRSMRGNHLAYADTQGIKVKSTTTSYGQWRQRRYIQLTGRIPHPHGQYSLSASCIV